MFSREQFNILTLTLSLSFESRTQTHLSLSWTIFQLYSNWHRDKSDNVQSKIPGRHSADGTGGCSKRSSTAWQINGTCDAFDKHLQPPQVELALRPSSVISNIVPRIGLTLKERNSDDTR